MQKSNSTYLYKYKNSSNYFFRIRTGVFNQIDYVRSARYFVASLQTSDYEEARWLALFIKSKLMEINDMDMSNSGFQNDNELLLIKGVKDEEHMLLKQKQQGLRAMMLFRKALKDRFEELLKAGKAMIGYELDCNVVIPKSILEEESKDFKQYCEENVPQALKIGLIEGLVPPVQNDNGETPSFQNDNDTVRQFAASLSMLNTLVTKLTEFKEEWDDFSVDGEIEQEPSVGSQQDVNDAVKMFDNIRNGFDEHQRAEKLKQDEYFTLAYQASIFLQEKKENVALKTFEKYERSFVLLLEHFPDGVDLREFTKVQTQSVKHMISNMDKHQNVGKEGGRLAPKTKNGILSNYRTFFSWLDDNTDIDIRNPFSKSAFALLRGTPKRRSFTSLEVKKILSYGFGHGNEAREFRSDAYWYPKIALYSGMRLNELSALPISHIKQTVDGVWYFDLNGLAVKNEASERTVPIAQHLLDSGILIYIEGLKAKGEVYLFPQIRKGVSEPGSAGWGDPISRWFNRTMLKNIGIDTDAELTKRALISFHSMRRTLISTCVTKGEEHYLIKRIVGHSVEDDITLSVYADMDQIPLARLKEVLDKNLTWHKKEVNMNEAVTSTFGLFERWDISDEQKSALLGIPQSVSLSKVQSEPDAYIAFSPDLKDRCILLLDINVKLEEIFSNPQNVEGYMTMLNNNTPYMGSMPIELACSSLEGLKQTHQAIAGLANSIG
jgi:integrase